MSVPAARFEGLAHDRLIQSAALYVEWRRRVGDSMPTLEGFLEWFADELPRLESVIEGLVASQLS